MHHFVKSICNKIVNDKPTNLPFIVSITITEFKIFYERPLQDDYRYINITKKKDLG